MSVCALRTYPGPQQPVEAAVQQTVLGEIVSDLHLDAFSKHTQGHSTSRLPVQIDVKWTVLWASSTDTYASLSIFGATTAKKGIYRRETTDCFYRTNPFPFSKHFQRNNQVVDMYLERIRILTLSLSPQQPSPHC